MNKPERLNIKVEERKGNLNLNRKHMKIIFRIFLEAIVYVREKFSTMLCLSIKEGNGI